MLIPAAKRKLFNRKFFPNWDNFSLTREPHQFKVIEIYLFFFLLLCLFQFCNKLILFFFFLISTSHATSKSKAIGFRGSVQPQRSQILPPCPSLYGSGSFALIFDGLLARSGFPWKQIWEHFVVERNFGKVSLKTC